ncbi:MAG: hydantoinase/oxoprolinase family protein, partial [Acidobacteria bacterium]|nr:hydantoinase/oxoprolinase family protein [Acidobacteriota bacterium]
ERALRLVSIERGHDPRHFTLVAFGGGGGLHAASLAEALRIEQVLIPVDPGAFSALGVLLADVTRDYSRTVMETFDPAGPAWSAGSPGLTDRYFAELEAAARADLGREGYGGDRLRLERFLAVRYRGQSFELVVPADEDPVGAFHQLHHTRYGHSDRHRPVEVVSVRLRAVGITVKPQLRRKRQVNTGAGRPHPAPSCLTRVWFGSRATRTPVFERGDLEPGMRIAPPAVIVEYGSTTILPGGWGLAVDPQQNLLLSRL